MDGPASGLQNLPKEESLVTEEKGLHTLQGFLKVCPERAVRWPHFSHPYTTVPFHICSLGKEWSCGLPSVAEELQLGRLELPSEKSLSPGSGDSDVRMREKSYHYLIGS